MKQIISFIRTILFNSFFFIWTTLSCLICIPLWFTPPHICRFSGHLWSWGVLVGLRWICGINYKIEGKEHLPKEGGFILACKHQSVWDTVVFLHLFPWTCYVLKKELLKIPLFGQYLKSIRMISVDRAGGSGALKGMIQSIIKELSYDRTIIIFPEGTRTLPGQDTPYHPGIAFAYLNEDMTKPIIPVALNSGCYWHKKQFLKPPGTITIRFLPAIEKGLDRKRFMAQLKETIEHHSTELMSH